MTVDFQAFSRKMESKYNIVAVSIYTEKNGVYNCLYGDKIPNIEEYGAYTNSKIKENAVGLKDDKRYKSRFITKVVFSDIEYIIILSSFALHTFRSSIKEIGQDVLNLGLEIDKIR